LIPFSALIDASTNALLVLTNRIDVVAFLVKSEPETVHVIWANHPNYLGSFGLAKADPKTYPQWRWDEGKRLFERTEKGLIDQRLVDAAALATAKGHALIEIFRTLSGARFPLVNGVVGQDRVYVAKKMEAQQYREGDDELEFPYLLQYSEISGLPMRAVADEILLKARFDDDLLLKTESFRLRYLAALKQADMPAKCDLVLREFRKEFFDTMRAKR